jgi:surface antigen
MTRHNIVTLVIAAALGAPHTSMAAYSDFYSQLPSAHMTKEDAAIARKAINSALDDGENGNTYRWENPSTGANGSLKVKSTFSRDGMTCRDVDFAAAAKGRKNAGPWKVCKTADGWKVVD